MYSFLFARQQIYALSMHMRGAEAEKGSKNTAVEGTAIRGGQRKFLGQPWGGGKDRSSLLNKDQQLKINARVVGALAR
jgi:hypothetical protein